MKLFVFYIGGSVPGAHLELHDMRFAVGESAEACWPSLAAQWWGEPVSLHLDAWGALEYADGHAIEISREPSSTTQKLWFVHLGGYDEAQFTELHHNTFMVAPDARTAKLRAMEAAADWSSPHKDAQLEVDSVIDVAASVGPDLWHVHLTPSDTPQPFRFDARYVPIGKMMRR